MKKVSKQRNFFTFSSGAMSTNVTVVMNPLSIAYANEYAHFLVAPYFILGVQSF